MAVAGLWHRSCPLQSRAVGTAGLLRPRSPPSPTQGSSHCSWPCTAEREAPGQLLDKTLGKSSFKMETLCSRGEPCQKASGRL